MHIDAASDEYLGNGKQNSSVEATVRFHIPFRALFAMVMAAVFIAVIVTWVGGLLRGEYIKDSKTFPDEGIERYLLANVDKNGDGYLSNAEKLDVRSVSGLGEYGVKSLKGIETFSNLETIDASNAGVESLWREPWMESESLGKVTTINLSGNPLLSCLIPSGSCKNILSLDISNCQLKSFTIGKENHGDELTVDLQQLESLNCSNNQLTGELVVNASHLRVLNCANNQLKTIEFKTEGGFLTGSPTPQELKEFYCQNNRLVRVGENFEDLGGYSFYLDNLTAFDISNNPSIGISEDGTYLVSIK